MSTLQKQAARKFVKHWTFWRGSEKDEDRKFWNSLQRNVLSLTNMVYALPNGNQFTVNLTRKASRKELVTLRDYSYGAQSAYWYSTDYDLIGRPTNATDSVSLMREWLYNNRSELASATIGMNQYGYKYDTIGVPFYDRFAHFSEEWIGINLAKTWRIL